MQGGRDFIKSLLLNLIATVVCYHLALVRQVQLFLTTNNFPSLLQEDAETVHRDITGLTFEQALLLPDAESLFERGSLRREFILLVNLVWHHLEIELEEI